MVRLSNTTRSYEATEKFKDVQKVLTRCALIATTQHNHDPCANFKPVNVDLSLNILRNLIDTFDPDDGEATSAYEGESSTAANSNKKRMCVRWKDSNSQYSFTNLHRLA